MAKGKAGELVNTKVEEMLVEALHNNHIETDGINFDSLESCEGFVEHMAHMKRVSQLVMSLMIVHIRDRHLYPEDMSWDAYKRTAKDRMNLHPQDMWRYEKIGTSFVMYYPDLKKLEIGERGYTTKLMFLNEAVVKHNKRSAMRNFKEMTKEEFELWVRDKPARVPFKGREFGITEKGVLYQGKEVVTFEALRDIAEAGKVEELRAAIDRIRRG